MHTHHIQNPESLAAWRCPQPCPEGMRPAWLSLCFPTSWLQLVLLVHWALGPDSEGAARSFHQESASEEDDSGCRRHRITKGGECTWALALLWCRGLAHLVGTLPSHCSRALPVFASWARPEAYAQQRVALWAAQHFGARGWEAVPEGFSVAT